MNEKLFKDDVFSPIFFKKLVKKWKPRKNAKGFTYMLELSEYSNVVLENNLDIIRSYREQEISQSVNTKMPWSSIHIQLITFFITFIIAYFSIIIPAYKDLIGQTVNNYMQLGIVELTQEIKDHEKFKMLKETLPTVQKVQNEVVEKLSVFMAYGVFIYIVLFSVMCVLVKYFDYQRDQLIFGYLILEKEIKIKLSEGGMTEQENLK